MSVSSSWWPSAVLPDVPARDQHGVGDLGTGFEDVERPDGEVSSGHIRGRLGATSDLERPARGTLDGIDTSVVTTRDSRQPFLECHSELIVRHECFESLERRDETTLVTGGDLSEQGQEGRQHVIGREALAFARKIDKALDRHGAGSWLGAGSWRGAGSSGAVPVALASGQASTSWWSSATPLPSTSATSMPSVDP